MSRGKADVKNRLQQKSPLIIIAAAWIKKFWYLSSTIMEGIGHIDEDITHYVSKNGRMPW